jgi:hypothetical protein
LEDGVALTVVLLADVLALLDGIAFGAIGRISGLRTSAVHKPNRVAIEVDGVVFDDLAASAATTELRHGRSSSDCP